MNSKIPPSPRLAIRSLVLLGLIHSAAAEVSVNPAIPITHRVRIQPIQVSKVDGTAATALGTTEQATYIKAQVNRIWAQAGVRIDWLPFTPYINDFAYSDPANDYTTNPRPNEDLDAIRTAAGSPPKSGNVTVINLFFVEICPGFQHLDALTANGLAFVDSNGITVHVGANLLTFGNGLDAIASVIAHEIGHNLGLNHEAFDQPNLMSPGGTTAQLRDDQRAIVFTNDSGTDGFDFLQALPTVTNYQQWATTNGIANGPDGDDDGDGIANVIEFMLGLNPKAPSLLPKPLVNASGMTWILPRNPLAIADGLVCQIQTGNDPGVWWPAGSANSGSTVLTSGSSTVSVRLNSGAAHAFMRLKVDSGPVSVAASAASVIPEEDTGPGTSVIPEPLDRITLTPP